jgi:Bardet-Biedl syndrome 2 protein
MKRLYSDLFSLNNELIGEYTKRSNNHNELLNALKEVNQMIQRAARLRVGNAKTRVVTLCRTAVKENNVQALFQIIETGNTRSAGI